MDDDGVLVGGAPPGGRLEHGGGLLGRAVGGLELTSRQRGQPLHLEGAGQDDAVAERLPGRHSSPDRGCLFGMDPGGVQVFEPDLGQRPLVEHRREVDAVDRVHPGLHAGVHSGVLQRASELEPRSRRVLRLELDAAEAEPEPDQVASLADRGGFRAGTQDLHEDRWVDDRPLALGVSLPAAADYGDIRIGREPGRLHTDAELAGVDPARGAARPSAISARAWPASADSTFP